MKKFYPILLCMAGLLWMNTACDDSDEGQGRKKKVRKPP